jgi:type II secretory pathway component PulF
VQAWGNRVSGAPSREEAVGALLERMIASNRARGELEQAILTSLQTYNDTVTNKMDELVQLQLRARTSARRPSGSVKRS